VLVEVLREMTAKIFSYLTFSCGEQVNRKLQDTEIDDALHISCGIASNIARDLLKDSSLRALPL